MQGYFHEEEMDNEMGKALEGKMGRHLLTVVLLTSAAAKTYVPFHRCW